MVGYYFGGGNILFSYLFLFLENVATVFVKCEK